MFLFAVAGIPLAGPLEAVPPALGGAEPARDVSSRPLKPGCRLHKKQRKQLNAGKIEESPQSPRGKFV